MPNKLTNRITGEFTPELAIVVYRYDADFYLESHKITDGQMEPGVPLQEEAIAEMVDVFNTKIKRSNEINGIIPDRLLYCNWEKKQLVWYLPASEQLMRFTKELSIPNGKAFQPSLIFVLEHDDLTVKVYQGSKRPTEDTKLFRAPYHNVSSDGSVCLGSAKSKKKLNNTYQSVIEHYEDLFWNSEFSHLAGSESPIKGNLNTYWKRAIKKKTAFDYAVLMDSEETFGSLIKSLK